MRTEVWFDGEVGRLEGLLEWPEDGQAVGGVVVAHPHPLYGGTMRQPVVHHVARACNRRGLATLRFNFRGVGGSAGRFSNLDEYRDVQAAVTYLTAQVEDRPVCLAGYSFGAVVAALAVVEGAEVARLGLVAFPVNWDETMPSFFSLLGARAVPIVAVCGELDDIAPPPDVETLLRGVGVDPRMVTVRGADHFFIGSGDQVGDAVAAFMLEDPHAA